MNGSFGYSGQGFFTMTSRTKCTCISTVVLLFVFFLECFLQVLYYFFSWLTWIALIFVLELHWGAFSSPYQSYLSYIPFLIAIFCVRFIAGHMTWLLICCYHASRQCQSLKWCSGQSLSAICIGKYYSLLCYVVLSTAHNLCPSLTLSILVEIS